MVTYFNRKDMVSFGNYLLSEKRKSRIEENHNLQKEAGGTPLPVDEAAEMVYQADVENWISDQKNNG